MYMAWQTSFLTKKKISLTLQVDSDLNVYVSLCLLYMLCNSEPKDPTVREPTNYHLTHRNTQTLTHKNIERYKLPVKQSNNLWHYLRLSLSVCML